MTPGKVQPGTGSDCSYAPVASTRRRGRNSVERPATMAATSCAENAAHTVASLSDPDTGQQRRLAQDGAVAELAVEHRRVGLVRGRQAA